MEESIKTVKASFSELVGKTFVTISGLEKENNRVIFECSDNSKYIMHHIQDCCESVYIEDICGDINDLVGNPLLQAEEVGNADFTKPNECDLSYSWTFYKLATVRGSVTIRWLGESNGYYSEEVDFEEIVK